LLILLIEFLFNLKRYLKSFIALIKNQFYWSYFHSLLNKNLKKYRIGKYKRYVKENSNILHLKTLKTFNRFDLKFYSAKKKK